MCASHCITYGNNKYVIGCNGGYILNSTDGINWTEISLNKNPSSNISLTYANGIFCGVIDSSNIGIYSSDGITWNETNIGTTSKYWSCVTYGNKLFVACANGTGGLAYSSDGINWVISDYNPSGTLSRMIFINNLFFGTISGSSTYVISYDGINWNEYNYSTSGYWLALIKGNDKWYNACRHSNKLAEWTGGYLDSLSYVS